MASINPPGGSEFDDDNDRALEDYVASFFGGALIEAPLIESPSITTKSVQSSTEESAEKKRLQSSGAKADADEPAAAKGLPENAQLSDQDRKNSLVAEPAPTPKPASQLAYPQVKKSMSPVEPGGPRAVFISADQIPADMPLNPSQKLGLQKLLDASIAASLEKSHDTSAAEKILPQSDAGDLPKAPLAVSKAQVIGPHLDEIATGSPLAPSDVLAKPKVPLELSANNQTARPLDGIPQDGVPKLPNYRDHWSGNLPSWATERFDVLLFSCRGVTLAIPLISLGHIYWQAEPLNQLPSMPEWVIGIKTLADKKLKVVDAGAYFFPSRPPTLDTEKNLHIIAIADSGWAFAVDSVANPSKMTRGDVQWQLLNRFNPWLAGAIKQHMCILIDTPALLTHLNCCFI